MGNCYYIDKLKHYFFPYTDTLLLDWSYCEIIFFENYSNLCGIRSKNFDRENFSII